MIHVSIGGCLPNLLSQLGENMRRSREVLVVLGHQMHGHLTGAEVIQATKPAAMTTTASKMLRKPKFCKVTGVDVVNQLSSPGGVQMQVQGCDCFGQPSAGEEESFMRVHVGGDNHILHGSVVHHGQLLETHTSVSGVGQFHWGVADTSLGVVDHVEQHEERGLGFLVIVNMDVQPDQCCVEIHDHSRGIVW